MIKKLNINDRKIFWGLAIVVVICLIFLGSINITILLCGCIFLIPSLFFFKTLIPQTFVDLKFSEEGIIICRKFEGEEFVKYDSFSEIAVGKSKVVKGMVESNELSKQIYLSSKELDESYRENLHLVRLEKGQILFKFAFEENDYQYLIKTLPEKYKIMLEESYNKVR